MTVAGRTERKLAVPRPHLMGLRLLLKKNPALVFGTALTAAIVILAIIGPTVAPYDPIAHDYTARLEPPSRTHLMGTDKFGRDIFSRVLYSARIDIQIAIICVTIPFVIGVAIGCISGYYGGAIETVLMRLLDLSVALPFYVLVISILAILGPGVRNMYVALILVGWIAYAKVARGEVLVAKNSEYVLAARALGYSNFRIMTRHLLPNVINPAIIYAMSDLVLVILAASALGFLGLGVQPPLPEWGVMVADGREFITSAAWLTIFPGLAIAITGISFSLLGDGLSSLLRPTDR
jgi:peptide/nickel transport system permease protein